MSDDRLNTMARKLMELREKYSTLDRQAKNAKKARDDYELAFWSALEDLGLKGFTMDDGTQVTRPKPTLYHEMLDKQALEEWARENGMFEEWFGPEPRRKALNEYVRSQIENGGGDLPPGLGFRSDKGIRITKGKK